MRLDVSSTSRWLSYIHAFLEQFGWLADSFVLDFYVDNHWSKLPASWTNYLESIGCEDLKGILDLEKYAWEYGSRIPPLSLMAFKQTVRVLSMSRRMEKDQPEVECDEDIKKLFTRHVKLKKRHEVERMGEVISCLCNKTGATHVYDVGSGMGHLSRYLAYACGLNLTCVDKEQTFGHGATKFDIELEKFLAKKTSSISTRPSHMNLTLELDHHERHFRTVSHCFGLTGLHCCGNLSPVILHNYVNSPAAFVVSLGCCYMKLDEKGFPLSDEARKLNLKLSYEALEVACHALEQYVERLSNNVEKLKVHSYRAALETILTSRYNIKRAGLRSVPHSEQLSFEEYARKATQSLEIQLHEVPDTSKHLEKWFQVVIFYSLRLLVANIIETTVLLDRASFLLQSNRNVHVTPIFDPKISARNLALISYLSE